MVCTGSSGSARAAREDPTSNKGERAALTLALPQQYFQVAEDKLYMVSIFHKGQDWEWCSGVEKCLVCAQPQVQSFEWSTHVRLIFRQLHNPSLLLWGFSCLALDLMVNLNRTLWGECFFPPAGVFLQCMVPFLAASLLLYPVQLRRRVNRRSNLIGDGHVFPGSSQNFSS